MRLKSIDFKVAADLVREILPSAQTKIEKPKRGGEREALRNLWKGSVNVTVGDEVFRYLSNRRVLADPPNDLRFCPSAGYFEDGKKVGTYPAMLALVRDASGKPVTIHRTYLQDGKKAPVQSPKKLVSPIGAGACIRLFQASKAVCVTEGIETALAVRKVTGEPVWAAISAGGLKGWICPPYIKHVCIYADNDLNFVGSL